MDSRKSWKPRRSGVRNIGSPKPRFRKKRSFALHSLCVGVPSAWEKQSRGRTAKKSRKVSPGLPAPNQEKTPWVCEYACLGECRFSPFLGDFCPIFWVRPTQNRFFGDFFPISGRRPEIGIPRHACSQPWVESACADCPGFLASGAAGAPAPSFIRDPQVVPLN